MGAEGERITAASVKVSRDDHLTDGGATFKKVPEVNGKAAQ